MVLAGLNQPARYHKALSVTVTYIDKLKAGGGGNASSMAEYQQALQIIKQLKDMTGPSTPKDRRRIPNQNRYEVQVNQ